MRAITRNLEYEIWRNLMQRSGVFSLMGVQARDAGFRSPEHGNSPKVSETDILSTSKQLYQNKDELFERGEINALRGLSRGYKTRPSHKFGNEVIVNNLVEWSRWG